MTNSIEDYVDFSVIDASGDDETCAWLSYCGYDYVYRPDTNVGQAMNLAAEMMGDSNDIGMITADDYWFRPFWTLPLFDYFRLSKEERIILTCLNWEPNYAWNQVTQVMFTPTRTPVLIRQSIPGSNWVFKIRDIPKIFPVLEQTGGEDLSKCQELQAKGYKLAALDLTYHIGEQYSAWGNRSYLNAEVLGINQWLAEWKNNS